MQAKFLGYDARITYDDYDMHEVLIQELDELDSICKSLENCDTTFEIEYKKKYQLENGNFVYSKKEHISIGNQNIPERELLLRELDVLVQPISVDDNISDEDIQKCYTILGKLILIVNDKQ